ncbi:MAG: ribosome-binding factor A [Wolbachia endosymbiont of Menacanthus eurysternus]|nr:MAG: ribosome-binding factor A [Wolbachia endosymbiont of Menacanthus eurysternus]
MKKEIRNLKIASVLHKAISRVLMEGKVLLDKDVIISKVRLSKDLKKADVYVVLSSLRKRGHDDVIINEINRSAWLIRRFVLCYVDLRFIPELFFKTDLGFSNFIKVSKILNNRT